MVGGTGEGKGRMKKNTCINITRRPYETIFSSVRRASFVSLRRKGPCGEGKECYYGC